MTERDANNAEYPMNEGDSFNDRSRYSNNRVPSMRLSKFLDRRSVTVVLWVLGVILYLPVVVIRGCSGTLRLIDPTYKKHMHWLDLQNRHLDGLHDEGPDSDCEYCAGLVRLVADGGYYRPWSKQSPNKAPVNE